MISVSLCMIVKNEEDVIASALESVRNIADEIIVIDTGSVDRTKEIAYRYTDQIYDFEWIDDFSAARNYSFSKATMDYIMWLDADDIIREEDRKKLLRLKETLQPSVDIVMLKYNTAFDNDGNPVFSYFRERLLARKRNYQWVEPIHEVIIPYGHVIYEDIAITHNKKLQRDPKRNIGIMEKLLSQGKQLSPRLKFYYARELYDNQRYEEAANMFNDFLSSKDAWYSNCIDACLNLSNTYNMLNQPDKAFDALLRSFRYGPPRAEICCAIGLRFFNQHDYKAAIFWYELASQQEIDSDDSGFHSLDCYRYQPYMQLCVCYDRIGNRGRAFYYNEKAAEIKPNDASVEYNRNYFSKNPV